MPPKKKRNTSAYGSRGEGWVQYHRIRITHATKSGGRSLIEVKISDEMLLAGRKKATEMGLLHNSILRGGGSVAGFLGEQIVLSVMGGKWDNSYDYDIVLGDGRSG